MRFITNIYNSIINFIGSLLSDNLGLPIDASLEGYRVDVLIGWVHWLMLILFVWGGVFIIYVIIKFNMYSNPKADYHGIKGKFSKYLETGIVLVEVFLLIGLAIPGWAKLKADVPVFSETKVDCTIISDDYECANQSDCFWSEGEVAEDEGECIDAPHVELRVIAQQFAWNMHYPGADGKFGYTFSDLVNEATNPIGLDRSGFGADDIVTLNQLVLPKDRLVYIRLSSKDVIHSFDLPEMRVKQDAIPGIEIPIFFTPHMTTDEFVNECQRQYLSQGYDYRHGELFIDGNENGLYDNGEEFDDKVNGQWDIAETYFDCGIDALCVGDYDENDDEVEEADEGENNGQYDVGEYFIDDNNNNVWDDSEETFIDFSKEDCESSDDFLTWDYEEEFCYKDTGNGQWDAPLGFEILCAQLCGLGHYRMIGYMDVLESDDFDQWLIDNSPASDDDDDDWEDDDEDGEDWDC